MMQWDDVRYFLSLARNGSLSSTSRNLHVEHSTVARRVSTLEADIGVKLFDRLPRGWVLTAEGRELLDHASHVEDHVFSLQRAALGVGKLSGSVRISAPPALVSHFLTRLLADVQSRHPDITLDMIGDRQEANLTRREADIAIRLGPSADSDLIVRNLGTVGYGLYGTLQHIATPEQDQIFVGFDDSIPNLPQKLWLDQHVAQRRYGMRSNDLISLMQAASHGWGIALLPHFLARETKGLQELTTTQGPPDRPLFILMHPDVMRSPRVRLIADELIGQFADSANDLKGR
jgi:DNA-binding transcriptional LysR family regulator